MFESRFIITVFQTAKEGAQTTIYLAVADEVAYVSGEYFSDCKVNIIYFLFPL